MSTSDSTSEPQLTVLIVDDEPDIRMLVRVVFQTGDPAIEIVGEAADGPAALAMYKGMDPPRRPSVVILDNRMPGPSGLDVARTMLDRIGAQHIILFSAFLTPEAMAEARRLGITCVAKGDVDKLPSLVASLPLQPPA